jgi:hypothetical protein
MTQIDPATTVAATGGAPVTATAAPGGEDRSVAARTPWWRRPVVVGAALVAALALPLLVALGVLHSPRWFPILDLATTELRVRDVGTRHTPLVGMAGRIESDGVRGSHPGPLNFWSLRPLYTLFGQSSWSLQVATAGVHLAGMAVALWIAHRRGGVRLMVGLAALLAVLAHLYGAATLTEGWNPYVPVMWWLVFLLAAWSVLCDDLALLPVAVFAGSFCVQCHVGYLGLVAVPLAAVVAVLALRAWRRRDDRAALRRLAGWGGLALAVGAAVWLPPVLDQLRNDPGNLRILYGNFRHPTEAPLGPAGGMRLLGEQVDPGRLVRGDIKQAGVALGGYLLVAAWLASVVVAWRRRARPALLALDAVIGVALVMGAISAGRIFGTVFYYLTLWAWGIAVLMVLAIGWTVLGSGASAARRAQALTGAAVAVLVVFTGLFVADAAHTEVPAVRVSRVVGALAGPTVEALDAPGAPGGGRQGHYRVTWTDPVSLGAGGEGLILELERQGFDARGPASEEEPLGAHRVIDRADATGEVHLSVGSDIERWRRDHPEAAEVAYVDPRTPAERSRYQRLVAETAAVLDAAGLPSGGVEDRIAILSFDTATPEPVRRLANRLADLGQPAAVFVTAQPVTP